MTNPLSAATLLGRVLLSILFIISGLGKLAGYADAAQSMADMNVPPLLLPLVILTEFGCGIALLIGWQARLAAFLLAGFCILAGILFHLVPAGSLAGAAAQAEMTNFVKNLAISGGLLMVTGTGAGRYSLDARRGRA